MGEWVLPTHFYCFPFPSSSSSISSFLVFLVGEGGGWVGGWEATHVPSEHAPRALPCPGHVAEGDLWRWVGGWVVWVG